MALSRITYTFEEIVTVIKNTVNEFSENKPTYWGDDGIAMSFTRALANRVEHLQFQTNLVYITSRISTSFGRHLSNLLEDFGFPKKSKTYAQAVQQFNAISGRVVDITIPQGTVVTTTNDYLGNNIRYALANDIVLNVANSSVTGVVTCLNYGDIGNVLSGEINILENNLTGISGTINLENIGNGSNGESDKQYRERFYGYLIGLQRGNRDAIRQAALSIEGVTYADILPNFPSNGTFTVFINTVNGFADSILKRRVKDKIDTVKAFCITSNVISAIPSYITVKLQLQLNTDDFNTEGIISEIKYITRSLVNVSARNVLYKSDIIAEL